MATPTRPIGRPGHNRGMRYPVEVLTQEEVGRLMRGCSRRAPTGLRNRALIALLYGGGLRISEALALHPKDLDLAEGSLSVLSGKGGKRRPVVVPGGFAEVERWLDKRAQLGLNGRHPLFCTLEGRALSPQYVRALLPRLAKRAGIEKRVHPHGLRHSHAVELRRRGVPLETVSAQLGHSNLATTDRYLAGLSTAERLEPLKQLGLAAPAGERERLEVELTELRTQLDALSRRLIRCRD
jgi:integrase/recombinase XerD